MSRLRKPGLGPIVGHTTDTTSRIWIRATDSGDTGNMLDTERRTLGVLGLVNNNGSVNPRRVYYFRLHREFDRTGTFVIGGKDPGLMPDGKNPPLTPDTRYRVRVGTLTLDDPYANDENIEDDVLVGKLPPTREWADDLEQLPENQCAATFRTFARPPKAQPTVDSIGFLSGSCRYPGLLFKCKLADKIFRAVLTEAERVRDGVEPSFVLMTGDQIYADTVHRLSPFGRADTFREFQERHHTAFGSTNMRRLLQRKPTYMILDDHEIEDNWTQDRLCWPDRMFQSNKRQLFTIAMDAYMSYQWSHGPRTFGRRLFYAFECGGYPFFVCDTRTQRYMDDDEKSLDDNHLLGRPSFGGTTIAQIDKLLQWLLKQPRTVPKFIVTPSVFVPNPIFARDGASQHRKEKSDSWPAFPTTRRAILDCIHKNSIQNVIFLSGDVHCANVAQLTFNNGGENLKVYSITSSAFYWPFPFSDGDPSNFVHDSQGQGQDDPFVLTDRSTIMHYKAWNFTQEDNFCRIDVHRKNPEIVVRTFDETGEIVRDEITRACLKASLPLEPW